MGIERRFGGFKAPEASKADIQDAICENDLVHELDQLRSLWSASTSTRDRTGIYPFLEGLFELVTSLQRRGRIKLLLETVAQQSPTPYETTNPLMAVIHCVTRVDSRTRSKWSRALGFAERKKLASESLKAFILRHGGINECASGMRKMR